LYILAVVATVPALIEQLHSIIQTEQQQPMVYEQRIFQMSKEPITHERVSAIYFFESHIVFYLNIQFKKSFKRNIV
jgi:hypothetical protein